MKFDAQAIAAATGGTVLRDGPAGDILTDTRTLGEGSWFLAIVGERFDAHEFLQTAADAGAIGAIVSKDPGPDWTGGAVLVDDTTKALQDLGRAARARITVPVVALTGSSGKTTTRALIALALGQLGRVHQTVGNLNNHFGVPMTLLATPDDAAAVVVEMGTSGPGEIALLADIGQPDVRLVINIGPAHLEELGGLKGVAREKGALLKSAREGDAVIINLDDPNLVNFPCPEHARRISFGMHDDADVRLVDAQIDAATRSTHATWRTPTGLVHAAIPAPGVHIAMNAAAALAAASALRLDLVESASDLAGYRPVGMRLRFETLPDGVVALNDAYNANPQSMQASLGVLSSMPGRKVAVLGDMLELGPDEASWHERVVRTASTSGVDLLVLVGPRMAAAASAARGVEVWAHADANEAIGPLSDWVRSGDHLLFKGSRGARVERVLQGLTMNLESR